MSVLQSRSAQRKQGPTGRCFVDWTRGGRVIGRPSLLQRRAQKSPSRGSFSLNVHQPHLLSPARFGPASDLDYRTSQAVGVLFDIIPLNSEMRPSAMFSE